MVNSWSEGHCPQTWGDPFKLWQKNKRMESIFQCNYNNLKLGVVLPFRSEKQNIFYFLINYSQPFALLHDKELLFFQTGFST